MDETEVAMIRDKAAEVAGLIRQNIGGAAGFIELSGGRIARVRVSVQSRADLDALAEKYVGKSE